MSIFDGFSDITLRFWCFIAFSCFIWGGWLLNICTVVFFNTYFSYYIIRVCFLKFLNTFILGFSISINWSTSSGTISDNFTNNMLFQLSIRHLSQVIFGISRSQALNNWLCVQWTSSSFICGFPSWIFHSFRCLNSSLQIFILALQLCILTLQIFIRLGFFCHSPIVTFFSWAIFCDSSCYSLSWFTAIFDNQIGISCSGCAGRSLLRITERAHCHLVCLPVSNCNWMTLGTCNELAKSLWLWAELFDGL